MATGCAHRVVTLPPSLSSPLCSSSPNAVPASAQALFVSPARTRPPRVGSDSSIDSLNFLFQDSRADNDTAPAAREAQRTGTMSPKSGDQASYLPTSNSGSAPPRAATASSSSSSSGGAGTAVAAQRNQYRPGSPIRFYVGSLSLVLPCRPSRLIPFRR